MTKFGSGNDDEPPEFRRPLRCNAYAVAQTLYSYVKQIVLGFYPLRQTPYCPANTTK